MNKLISRCRISGIHICFFALLSASLISCDSGRIFDENREIENNTWDQKDKLQFKVKITDTIPSYDIYLNIRNAGWYPYSNVFIFITARLPNGSMAKDTAECTLADKDGRWLGDGLGDIWDNKILFKKDFHFPMAGEYVFDMEQAMRVNPLPGIMDAGFRIEKSKK